LLIESDRLYGAEKPPRRAPIPKTLACIALIGRAGETDTSAVIGHSSADAEICNLCDNTHGHFTGRHERLTKRKRPAREFRTGLFFQSTTTD
jgi:hypothetical protein